MNHKEVSIDFAGIRSFAEMRIAPDLQGCVKALASNSSVESWDKINWCFKYTIFEEEGAAKE